MVRSVISPDSSPLPALPELMREDGEQVELCVARHRLGQSRDREQLFRGIEEIVAAIVGSEEYAVFECDPVGGRLQVVSSVGVDPDWLELPTPDGRIEELVSRGEVWVAENAAAVEAANDELPLTACIPLRQGETITGAIAIFRLLPQKKNYMPVDHDLFRFLSTHAGAAMQATAGR